MTTTIGTKIQRFRQEKRMSIDELAFLIGKSKATLYRYENGDIEKVPYTVLVPIAKALDTTPAILLGTDATELEPVSKLMTLCERLNLLELTDEEIDEVWNFAVYTKGKRKHE